MPVFLLYAARDNVPHLVMTDERSIALGRGVVLVQISEADDLPPAFTGASFLLICAVANVRANVALLEDWCQFPPGTIREREVEDMTLAVPSGTLEASGLHPNDIARGH